MGRCQDLCHRNRSGVYSNSGRRGGRKDRRADQIVNKLGGSTTQYHPQK